MWYICRVRELSGGCLINATAAKTRRPLHRESVAVRMRLKKIKGFCEREDTPPTVCDVHARVPSPTPKCCVFVSTAVGRPVPSTRAISGESPDFNPTTTTKRTNNPTPHEHEPACILYHANPGRRLADAYERTSLNNLEREGKAGLIAQRW